MSRAGFPVKCEGIEIRSNILHIINWFRDFSTGTLLFGRLHGIQGLSRSTVKGFWGDREDVACDTTHFQALKKFFLIKVT